MTEGYATLLERLGVPVSDDMLTLALTHRSFAYEQGGLPTNERLEFLGDAVLGLVVTETLYRDHPEVTEGQLAKFRAAVVNARALAEVARDLGLGDHIRLGRGEEATGGRDKSSILSDTLEAIIGAVYLESGPDAAQRTVHALFDPLIARASSMGAGLDWKTSLQERSAELGLGVPEYVVEESGPDHAKQFVARVRLGELVFAPGDGGSKKEAEQQAAQEAYAALETKPISGHVAR